ncbi:hypothetical protein B9Z55_023855 [Caenorhabditis nigoni]|uniref:Sodium-dependent phosphate transport protein 2B n=1 Tax=Caenorhabditis nigoni TaxID=1611254 RepID=A0A2G5SS93_9PELO|nr:hypothetical protein B9Z55_023855 [Caenorhabditis nigoni]
MHHHQVTVIPDHYYRFYTPFRGHHFMPGARVGDETEPPAHKKSIVSWTSTPTKHKVKYYITCSFLIFLILIVLFIYVCSLANMSTAFGLLGSRGLGKAIQESPLINDPISAVIVGMLATVVLQSATTTTNILVTMVAANMITVHDAIPVMIGSELGSSLVNAMVSLAYSGKPEQFRRAFSAAILGDVFNICGLFVIFPMEMVTGLIEKVSWWIVDPLISEQGLSFKTLDLLTDPINQIILQVNEAELLNATIRPEMFAPNHSFVQRCSFTNGTRIYNCPYHHLFAYTSLSDKNIGWIVLFISIFCLVMCLVGIVYLIQKLLDGHAANYVRNLLSKECPGMFKPCTGYLVMLVGLVVTILIQSNSIFSSSLTPLVGSGVVSLEQMYPLVLGSNIGTTFSGVLAAFSTDPSRFEKALHMAMCQVIYNIIGTCLFYIVPCTRKFPVYLSIKLGDITDKYRWFIVVFIITFFLIIPFTIIGLTLLPDNVIVIVFIIILIIALMSVLLCILQNCCVEFLPPILHDWKFLPVWMRSLKYYDPFMCKIFTGLPMIGGFFRNGGAYRKRTSENDLNTEDDLEKKVQKLVQLSGHSQV